ncbi:sister chromatid cohesion protein PDS5 homolog D-like [Andrographis paniculata]|uniref:sister chromatid cohesion protein PDS5 homolog D-like n=1 Tax=Andrographis paniculata TaxID=175694 RepID=UPI0021E789B6|nr:sister chromatid cohesion protein PDS5 homolog D-like [Andrographis paniculata]
MATVMSVMINEADYILADCVKILLSSIKLDNKYASPRAWELGKTVVEKCATKLQPHVREAVKMLNLEVKAYAGIVSSLCQDMSDGEKSEFRSKRKKRKSVPSNTRERNSGSAGRSAAISGGEPEREDEQLLHLSRGRDDAVNKVTNIYIYIFNTSCAFLNVSFYIIFTCLQQ